MISFQMGSTELLLSSNLLTDCPPGSQVRIVDLLSDQTTMCRLCEMGLTINSNLYVVRNTRNTPLIVQSRNSRVVIIQEIAQLIEVETLRS